MANNVSQFCWTYLVDLPVLGFFCWLIRPICFPVVNCGVARNCSGSVIGLHQSIVWAMSLLRPIGSMQHLEWCVLFMQANLIDKAQIEASADRNK